MPINQNIVVEKKEGLAYDPIPENIYQVELLDINVKEVFKYKSTTEKENVLDFQFTILSGKDKDGTDLRCRNLWRNYVPTYLYEGAKGKNVLYQIVEKLLKRELTREEEATMGTEKLNGLIGKQCRVFVINKTKDDKTYSNIDKFLVAETELPKLTMEEKAKCYVKEKKEEVVEERTLDNTHPFPTEPTMPAIDDVVDDMIPPSEWN
jgi:hypothetical protein